MKDERCSACGTWGGDPLGNCARPDCPYKPLPVEPVSVRPCCERDRDGDGNCDRHPAGRPGPDGGMIYFGPFSGANAAIELRCWRLFGADVAPFLEAALAAQGEAPDGKLLSLQHALAELLRSSAKNQQERIIQTS